MRCKSVEKYICIIYIKVNLQNNLLLQTAVNSKPLYKQKKMGFAGHVVKVKLQSKVRISLQTLTVPARVEKVSEGSGTSSIGGSRRRIILSLGMLRCCW